MLIRPRKLIALLWLLGASCCAGWGATTVFTQPVSPDGSAYTALTSESTSAGVLARTYDSFVLASAADIGVVTWVGLYINVVDGGQNPQAADATSFSISFWSNNAGKPGALLATSQIKLAETDQTYLGIIGYALPTGETSAPQYSYKANLPNPFPASAGETYWISIVANTPLAEPFWFWKSGTGGNGKCVQDENDARSIQEGDRAFTLEQAPAPTLTVAATVSTAQEGGSPGVFTFKLSAAQAVTTVVRYTLKGNAVNGEDYALRKETVKIKPHGTTATLRIVPKGAPEGASSKRVKLMLEPESAYTIGTPGVVVITLEK